MSSRKVPEISAKLQQRLGVDTPPRTAKPRRKATPRPKRPSEVRLEPVLIVSDLHAPYHSKAGWNLLLQVGKALKPKTIVIIGDFADFYSVSDHDKSAERANRMDDELESVEKCLDQLDALGASDKIFVEGNHENRLQRYLMKNPALARVVSTEKLLNLKKRGWEFVPYKRHIRRGAIHYTHDVGVCGRNAVYRALETYQHSIVSGHTHRLAYVVEGSAVGDCKISATFGWLGDVEQVDYMNLASARKNWALGFGIGYQDPATGFVYLTPIPIVDGTVCVNGRLFRAAA